MKSRDFCKKYNINRQTLCNWMKENQVVYKQLPNNRYDYLYLKNENINSNENSINNDKLNVIYGRVSTNIQKENLQRQIDRLKIFCSSKGITVNEIISDIGSSLNYNRIGYRKLINLILKNKINYLIIEYKDRLLRIGFEDFENLCKQMNVELIILDGSLYSDKDKMKEITDDLISIIHHYSMKIYSSRKRKQIKELLKNENN
jgi:putative resolvase